MPICRGRKACERLPSRVIAVLSRSPIWARILALSLLFFFILLTPLRYIPYLNRLACIISVEAGAIQIVLASSTYWLGRVTTVNESPVSMANVDFIDRSSQLNSFYIIKGADHNAEVTLNELSFAAGSRVRFETDSESGMTISIWDGKFFCSFLAKGNTAQETAQGVQTFSFDDMEFIELSYDADTRKPATMKLFSTAPLSIDNISVTDISFSLDVPANRSGQVKSGSAIITGDLSLPAVGKTIKLSPGYFVRLENVSGFIPQLHVDKTISLRFEGTVTDVITGPPDYQRTLSPTLLEYLYYDQRWSVISAIISAIVAILGKRLF